METTRQNKISRLIQKDMAEILQKEGKDLFHGILISVTNVAHLARPFSRPGLPEHLSVRKGNRNFIRNQASSVENPWSAWSESRQTTSDCSTTRFSYRRQPRLY